MPKSPEERLATPEGAIANRLKRERIAAGLTADQAAVAGCVGRTTQFSYESGDSIPDAVYLSHLRDSSVGIDVWFVLTGERERKTDVITAGERELLDRYNSLPPPLREVVDKVVLVSCLAYSDRAHRDELAGAPITPTAAKSSVKNTFKGDVGQHINAGDQAVLSTTIKQRSGRKR